MTTATTPEEELLIITEEEEVTDKINLDLSEIKEEKTQWDIISFWEEENKESIEINLEEKSSDNKSNIIDSEIWNNELDFSFDLWGEDKEVTVEEMLWEKVDNNSITNELEKKSEEETNDFSIDLNSEEKDNKENFDFNINTEEKWEIEEPISKINDNINLDFQIPTNNEEITKKSIIEKKEEIKVEKKETEKEDKIIEEKAPKSTSKKDDSQSSGQGDDTNTILDETIQKLKVRKNNISYIKKESLTKIAKLKEEIKDLQSEVRKGTKEVKNNDIETAKIDENIKLLTKMKV